MRVIRLILPGILALALVSFFAAPALAAAPAWSISSTPTPTNFEPGDSSGRNVYEIRVTNSGGAATNGNAYTITDVLPKGLGVKDVELLVYVPESDTVEDLAADLCETTTAAEVSTVKCTVASELVGTELRALGASEAVRVVIHLTIPPSASGTLENFAQVQGGGAPLASTAAENLASSTPANSGFYSYETELTDANGLPVTAAGSHPYQFTTTFAVNTQLAPEGSEAPFVPAGGDLKDTRVSLPPGLIGDPTATELCTPQQFNTPGPGSSIEHAYNSCPDGSAIGLVIVQQVEGAGGILGVPVYNLVPPKGMPAQLGFTVAGAPFYIDTALRTGSDYGIDAYLNNTTEVKRVTAASVIIWGTPADKSHDPLRGSCLGVVGFTAGECASGGSPSAFLRMPTSCADQLPIAMRFNTWNAQNIFSSASSVSPAPINCSALDFDPTITVAPQTTVADSPSGLAVNLHIPQNNDPDLLAQADLKDSVVTLPAGMSVNPASASGLVGCSPAQIDLDGRGPANCPEAAKVGAVEVHTPLLDHPIKGAVYVATQTDNPFGSLIAIYIAAHDPQTGVVLKLAGEVSPNPVTGQLTTTFKDNPQLPFEDLTVTFFDGPRASLRTPMTCATYTATTSLTPFSAPESGPPATPSDSFQITSGPAGPCPTGALAAKLSAGVAQPIAGSYTPFVMRITRDDGTGEFNAVSALTPEGLTAKLAGIPYCPEAQIAQAAARTAPGQGALEVNLPSCPSTSAVGTITAGAGAGPSPYFTSGTVYLAGPYKGAPLSLVAVIPALAGPFDLGVVTNRIALAVNPETAQVSAVSDPFPTVLAGIPLDVRDVRVQLNRPGFTLAPTSCEPKQVLAAVSGPGGIASAADRFQVGACKALDFAPRMRIKTTGATKRDQHPKVRTELKTRGASDANLKRLVLTLPPSLQIDNDSVENPCTRAQFAENACPPSTILGRARVFTPLVDEPLEGPLYFRSNGGARLLPDIVADLRGQVRVVLVGAVKAMVNKRTQVSRLRTTFATTPDAPFSKAVVTVFGGKDGWLVFNRNICKRAYRAKVKMKAQNGRQHIANPSIGTSCKKQRRR